MGTRLVILALAMRAGLPATDAHGPNPRKSAQDYPAHVESAAAEIGADYQVHSFSADEQMYFTKKYLVFEIGVYPRKTLTLGAGSFELRVNGTKRLIEAAPPEFVAASLKYADLTQHPHAETGAGIGDTGVTLGAPPVIGRFPGDPSVRTYPQPPRAPEDPLKSEKEATDPAQLAIDTALRPGNIGMPMAGNVYFEYSGKVKKITSLTLIFHTAEGDLDIVIQ